MKTVWILVAVYGYIIGDHIHVMAYPSELECQQALAKYEHDHWMVEGQCHSADTLAKGVMD